MRPEIWKEAIRATDDCPGADRWGAWLEGSLTAAEQEALETHRLSCPRCDAEVGLMREFLQAGATPEEAAQTEWIATRVRSARRGEANRRRSFWQWLWSPDAYRIWAYAAMLLLFAGALLEWRRRLTPELDERQAGILRSIRPIVLQSQQGDLSRPPEEIRWQEVGGATRYKVRLLEVDDRVVWEGESAGTELILPGEAVKLFSPHKTLLVHVQAWNAAGQLIAESAKTRLRHIPGG